MHWHLGSIYPVMLGGYGLQTFADFWTSLWTYDVAKCVCHCSDETSSGEFSNKRKKTLPASPYQVGFYFLFLFIFLFCKPLENFFTTVCFLWYSEKTVSFMMSDELCLPLITSISSWMFSDGEHYGFFTCLEEENQFPSDRAGGH